jgi:hypothetical protein
VVFQSSGFKMVHARTFLRTADLGGGGAAPRFLPTRLNRSLSKPDTSLIMTGKSKNPFKRVAKLWDRQKSAVSSVEKSTATEMDAGLPPTGDAESSVPDQNGTFAHRSTFLSP